MPVYALASLGVLAWSFTVVREMQGNTVKTTYKGTVSGTTMKLTGETEGRGPRDVTLTKQ